MVTMNDDPRAWMFGTPAQALMAYVDGLTDAETISPKVATELLKRAKAYADNEANKARADSDARHTGKVFVANVTLIQEDYDRLKAENPNAFWAPFA